MMARTASQRKAAARRPAGKNARAKKVAAKTAPAKKAIGRGTSAKASAPKAALRRGAKAAVKTASRGRTATTAKTARAVKPVAPAKRKAATRRPAPRKTAPPVSAASRNQEHRFAVSHLNEADFKTDGLRAYAKYRDLGIAEATGGLCQAHVIRLVPPCSDEVRKRHAHNVDLQMVYVLKGWVKNEFEGHGEQMMSAGSCWLQPSGIEHTVLDYSPDCELLEIIVPADFKTTELT
jgi:hypothetical protein